MANILDKIMHNGDEYELPEWIPSGWTDWQFLGKVSGDTAWTDAPVTSVNWSTWAVTVNDTKVASSAPTATEWTLWYDSANDKLKAYNGSSWDEIWGGITKVFTLSSTSDLTTAQDALDWYNAGWNPIIHYSFDNRNYALTQINPAAYMYFTSTRYSWDGGYTGRTLYITISSWSVTWITEQNWDLYISSVAPWTWTANTIITIVV